MRRFILLLLIVPAFSFAQKLASIEDKTKTMKKFEGFFNFYLNEDDGKIYLEINKLDTEILYQTSLPAGIGSNDIGLDRGLLGDTRIVKFTKVGRKILMIQPNYGYRAITNDTNEKRAAEQPFAQSTLWGFTVEAETAATVLVDATDFLLRDAIKVSNILRIKKTGNLCY